MKPNGKRREKMEKIYVVEWASDAWGEHKDWVEKEFTELREAEAEVLDQVGFGNAVRMYIKES